MPKGYMNRFLFVDLSNFSSHIGVPDPGDFEQFIGGKGLGLKWLIDQGLITQEPFAADNPLIFMTGPMTGTALQTSARSVLVTKSPLTGTFLDSHAGGNFGPMIKRAGFDYIVISGRSKQPIFLHITPHEVLFEDATRLWGQGIMATEKNLRNQYPRARVAAIGPAGENLVRFACIGTDYYRQFGRGGAGAVMGSKNLKALVIEGDEKISIHDRQVFQQLNQQLTRDIMAHPNRQRRFDLGTMMWIRMGQEEGHFLPTRNFQEVGFSEYENITSETMKKELSWKSVGCFNCVIKCSKLARWDNYEVEGPEYETTAFLGSGCGIGNARDVAYANYLCDDLGLDTISAGVVCSFAMEAFEKGILSMADSGGLRLNFGDSQALFTLLEQIARRQGVGDWLAEGSKRASEKLGKGSDYFAIQTAGMELSGVNIKGCASMGLALATGDFASHTRFWPATAEMKGLLNFESTPAFVAKGQDEVNTRNSLIVCDFLPFDLDRLAPLYEALTGIKLDEPQMRQIGEKISNLTRMYNLKNGRTAKDDTLPQRFFKEKHLSGLFKDQFMSEEKFRQWLQIYYSCRGWDEDGVPSAKKLGELGLQRL